MSRAVGQVGYRGVFQRVSSLYSAGNADAEGVSGNGCTIHHFERCTLNWSILRLWFQCQVEFGTEDDCIVVGKGESR